MKVTLALETVGGGYDNVSQHLGSSSGATRQRKDNSHDDDDEPNQSGEIGKAHSLIKRATFISDKPHAYNNQAGSIGGRSGQAVGSLLFKAITTGGIATTKPTISSTDWYPSE